MGAAWSNKLFLGDNLEVMRDRLPEAGVDLIYMDPPFNSNSAYAVRRRAAGGGSAGGRRGPEAFDDRWRWGPDAEDCLRRLPSGGPEKPAELLRAMCAFLGKGGAAAYLLFIAARLAEARRVLKDTGSIYLHCDPRAGHYLRLVMDALFGRANFRNEIIWSYRSGGGTSRRFGRKHDVILLYSKGPKFTFCADAVRVPYAAVIARKRKHLFNPRGKVPGDVWEIPRPPNHSREWTGYPTQKPEALLDRIVRAGSRPGDLVLDPFCGAGTTLVVAERLGRRWIGVDSAETAVLTASRRLRETFGLLSAPFEIAGLPGGSDSRAAGGG